MGWLSLEHGPVGVRVDFAVYGVLVAAATAGLLASAPAAHVGQAVAWVLAGALAWSLAEYGLHRFVLHGLQPFQRWHALHHARPQALIATPTVLTVALFALLVALPAFVWLAAWQACAGLLGVLTGYLAYTATHHAVHHLDPRHSLLARLPWSTWLNRQRRWHAQHHRPGVAACYGVTGRAWDRVFGTWAPRLPSSTSTPAA